MAEHNHGSETEQTSTRRLAVVAAINLTGFVIELAGGLAFGSLALISDAIHMLFDALSYVMAFSATYTAEHYEEPGAWTFGLHRLEPTAALMNGVLLVPMALYILFEAYKRFLNPTAIDPLFTMLVAGGGLLVNIASVGYLHGDELSLNEKGAFFHLLGDTGASVAVIISTGIIATTGVRVVDPIVAALIAVLILGSAYTVLRDSLSLLLERSPISITKVEEAIHSADTVAGIEDVHVWQICSQLTVATVHAYDTVDSLDEREQAIEHIHEELEELGIDHATIELTHETTAATTQTHEH